MNMRSVDLNLLTVLHQLLLERHVSRAAERLNMSQPAVSRALQRLRATFDDPLLVKTSNGYDLSARAVVLLPQLEEWLAVAERLIKQPIFEAKKSSQTVRFYAPDPEVSWFLPPLFERMRDLAPGMSLQARSDPRDHFELLASGEVHFVLTPLKPSSNTAHLRTLQLAPMDFSIVMSEAHPLAREPLTLDTYIKANHGVISLTGRGSNWIEQRLIAQGVLSPNEKLRVPLSLSSFSSIAAFCEHSDVMFHLPRKFAEEIARGRQLIVRESLPELFADEKLHVYLYWHERFHRDPMCLWVRDQVREIFLAPGSRGEPG